MRTNEKAGVSHACITQKPPAFWGVAARGASLILGDWLGVSGRSGNVSFPFYIMAYELSENLLSKAVPGINNPVDNEGRLQFTCCELLVGGRSLLMGQGQTDGEPGRGQEST